jgi:hypothetical protein
LNDVLHRLYPKDPITFYQTPFGDHDPEEHRRRAEQAGFRDVRVEGVGFETVSESAEHWATGLVRGQPVAQSVAERGTLSMAEVERVVAEDLRRELGDRPVRTSIRAWVVTATA